ncbi:MAG TPA: hypothetical protein VGG77_02485 [Roseiarcus sp.]|jgi:hypothetical protein
MKRSLRRRDGLNRADELAVGPAFAVPGAKLSAVQRRPIFVIPDGREAADQESYT